MARLRYGKRFGTNKPNPPYEPMPKLWGKSRKPATAHSIVQGAQTRSATSLKKRGLEPPMPRVTLIDGAPPPRPDDRLKAIAANAIPGSRALSIVMQQGGALLILVQKKSHQHIVCVDIESEAVLWTEAQ